MRADHFTNHADFAEALGEVLLRSEDGAEHSLGSLWTGQPAALIFVRHFGCIGCSENVSLLAPRHPELAQPGFNILYDLNKTLEFNLTDSNLSSTEYVPVEIGSIQYQFLDER